MWGFKSSQMITIKNWPNLKIIENCYFKGIYLFIFLKGGIFDADSTNYSTVWEIMEVWYEGKFLFCNFDEMMNVRKLNIANFYQMLTTLIQSSVSHEDYVFF